MPKEREIEEKPKEVLRRATPDQSKLPALNHGNRLGDNIQINGDVVINQSGPFPTTQDRRNDDNDESAAKPISKKAKLPAGSLVALPIIRFVITIAGSAPKNSDIFPNGKIPAIETVQPIPKSDVAITPASLPADCHTYYNIGLSQVFLNEIISAGILMKPLNG